MRVPAWLGSVAQGLALAGVGGDMQSPLDFWPQRGEGGMVPYPSIGFGEDSMQVH